MITTSYYCAADGFLLVVDTSNLQACTIWRAGCCASTSSHRPGVRLLVGVVKHGREREVSSSAAWAFAAEHGMAYEEVGEGGDARAPFTALIRSMWDRPSALARTAAKGEVVASCCTPFATVGTFCQCWPWGWAKGPVPEPWRRSGRSRPAPGGAAFRGGVACPLSCCACCVRRCVRTRDPNSVARWRRWSW